MRIFLATAILIGATMGAEAITPLTTATCKTMKTEAMRRQCMLSAVDAPANVTGKTYSTNDVQGRGPIYIDQSAPPMPIAPVAPFVDATPGGRSRQR
ncbi:hypothetical protein GN316_07520 [Xylophilus sp. Kf1]|nr:hypothetical protein [Xylophilus sp. Kf1]